MVLTCTTKSLKPTSNAAPRVNMGTLPLLPPYWQPVFYQYLLPGHITTHWQESCPLRERQWWMYWTVLERFLWSALFGRMCMFVLMISRAQGENGMQEEAGGGSGTVIRSGPLTSRCADKVGHTLTHTQTAIPQHQSLITHLCLIFL